MKKRSKKQVGNRSPDRDAIAEMPDRRSKNKKSDLSIACREELVKSTRGIFKNRMRYIRLYAGRRFIHRR